MKILALLLITFSLNASERMYIDEDEMSSSQEGFHIHQGNNIWIVTDTVHRDQTGLFTFEANISKCPRLVAYEKKWKCPYCYMYWPLGKPCQNPDCPSKF